MTADRECVRRVRLGNRDAFACLVASYERRLFNLALFMTRERPGAEEVTQDAFVRAYTNLADYDEERPFYPWLATIAVRLAQNWLRQHQRRTRRERPALDAAGEPSMSARALGDLIADEDGQRLWRAVSTLPSGERTVVALFYRDDMRLSDIASALGVSVGTVKTLLFRARRHLRERLTPCERHV